MPFQERCLLTGQSATLKKNGRTSIRFNTRELFAESVEHYRCKLRLRGDVGLHPAWMYEGGLPFLYRDIDDSLSKETHHTRYCLKIKADGEDWPRRSYCKVQCPPKINSQYPVPEGGGDWRFQCMIKTQELRLDEQLEGNAEIRFDCFARKAGFDPRDISGEPEKTVTISLPEESCDWREFECQVPLDDSTAAILVTIAVEHAWGTVWLEDARLQNGKGFNILPPFEPANRYHEFFNWYGENLSHKEWTTLEFTLNGNTMPVIQFFQRCFRGSENEYELPESLMRDGENLLEIRNASEYHDPLPFRLEQAELLVERRAPVRIAWCPETVVKGREFGILLKTYEPDVRVYISAEGLAAPGKLFCATAGLHVLRARADMSALGVGLNVSAKGYVECVRIGRVVEREEDGVIAGSGDAIYIPQEIGEMEDFLIWYLENGLGNMITFRPVYRWSGTRECRETVWRRMKELCDGLNLRYSHIIDGRELPGLNANPSNDMLAGPNFLGHQAHERDGALYYWLQRKHPTNDILFEELSQRIFTHPDYRYREPVEYDGENVYLCFHPVKPRDMQEAAEQFVTKARTILRGVRRHTGPSTLFKYLFQAGLEVGGAELMYGPLEVLLAALRGASFAYDRPEFAAHLAVQWGTTPHDTEERYLRYQLALFVSYIQGVHHINTEEGLYRIEEFFAVFDRFSEPCRRHAQIEQDFVRFLSTHSRRGRMRRGIALLHGANDGWACFCRRNAWAHEGTEWEFGPPEESWDLIRVFYPDSVLDAIYGHPCPNEPQGYYTRTPFGSVDILPVEAETDKMRCYGAMAFLGWNTADESQLERLTDYVRQGGSLLLGWPHLFTEVSRKDALCGTPHPMNAELLTGVTLDAFFKADGIGPTLGRVRLSDDVEILESRNGLPFFMKRKLGRGEVCFVNAREYPAAPAVRPIYEKALRLFGERDLARQREEGVIVSNDTVETTIYDREDGLRVIYGVNTDWYTSGKVEAEASLLLGRTEYPVHIRRGCISVFTVCGNTAVQTTDIDTEVISICSCASKVELTLQGKETARIALFHGGRQESREISFPDSGRTTFGVELSESGACMEI